MLNYCDTLSIDDPEGYQKIIQSRSRKHSSKLPYNNDVVNIIFNNIKNIVNIDKRLIHAKLQEYYQKTCDTLLEFEENVSKMNHEQLMQIICNN